MQHIIMSVHPLRLKNAMVATGEEKFGTWDALAPLRSQSNKYKFLMICS